MSDKTVTTEKYNIRRQHFEEWEKEADLGLPLDWDSNALAYRDPRTRVAFSAYCAGFEEAWQHVSG